MIAGDLNFIMDIKLDKRVGRSDRGTAGRKEQKEWEKEFEITDAWRKQNTNDIGTTCTNTRRYQGNKQDQRTKKCRKKKSR